MLYSCYHSICYCEACFLMCNMTTPRERPEIETRCFLEEFVNNFILMGSIGKVVNIFEAEVMP